ncbi:MAG: hypothetical protein KJ047_13130 [Anaerolineae bacterium]|nr:hypothetical protein [Anaerolineae bacterium]
MQHKWIGPMGVIGLALALACIYAPWYTHSTAAFTLNAFDLAEWTSLHPAVRASSPALLTSFLLRAPQLTLVAALALLANGFGDARARWLLRAAALLIALRFLPPREFFGSAASDPNFRQMMLLTALSMGSVLAAILVQGLAPRWRGLLVATLLALGVGAGWWGLARAHTLLDNFEIAVSVGVGAVGYTASSALVALLGLSLLRWAERPGPANKKGG